MMFNTFRMALMAAALTSVAACQSSEEKAEAFYQSGLALVAEGDLDRAIVEFQNVFLHDGFHKEARRAFAELRLQQGNVRGAYGQYLRLIEQYPDTPDVRLTLAQIALDQGNWDEVTRHGQAAIDLMPDDPAVQSIATTLAYRAAVLDDDTATMATAGAEAQAQLDADPLNDVARRIVIDTLLRSETPFDAMVEIDKALEQNPESFDYNLLRLRLLTQVQNMAAVGTQLQRMVTLYPDDQELSQSLIRWYLAQGDITGAENFLRQLAGDDTAPPEGHVAVVQLIQAAQGPEAAQVELDRLAAANDGAANADIYRALSAVITFERGERDTAITILEEIVANAEPSTQTWNIRNILARLYIATGNQVGARAQVEDILTQDASNVDALKLRAAWAIDDDRGGDAILDLRNALGQAPRDAEILTLMASAHEREGSLALAGERLATAVDVSGSAPAESLRYAAYLQREGRTDAARSVLTDARSVSPRDTGILVQLANLLLSENSWVQAQGIANDLRAIDTPEAVEAATSLQAALLLGQNRVEDSLAYLEDEIAQGNADTNAVVQVVQIQLQAGNQDAAQDYLRDALADDPGNPTLRMLNANLLAVSGDFDQAEVEFRDLIGEFPQAEGPVLRLYNLLKAADRSDDAEGLITDALNAQPNSLNLRWVRAGELEFEGDIEGAIALYEAMYETNSNSVTIANNLASLIATHRDDTEGLERAATIAKRLRDTDVPAFQDTYGWIAYRLGNYSDARDYLEPAAAGLPDDPLVQYHLGMTYVALEDTAAARTQLTLALDLAGDSPLPQFETARTALQELGE